MDGRLHPEGIKRDQLTFVLSREDLVRTAVRIDRCLLCRSAGVNEAGLCLVCWPTLSASEQSLADRWTMGAPS